MNTTNKSRRRFIKGTAYAAPAILTLQALPAFARNGSAARIKKVKKNGNNGNGNGVESQPLGMAKPKKNSIGD